MSARAYGTTVVFGYYLPSTIYAGRTYSGGLAYTSYAVGGRTLADIYTDLSIHITPYARTGDIIFLWAGTNDMGGASDLTAQQTWDNYFMPYATAVIVAGAQLIVGTIIARDNTGMPAGMATRITNYNTLIANNAVSMGYTVCDFAADSHFDGQADASNTTYYLSDKLHLATGGYDIIVPIGITALNTVLAA